jgi:uncharacterized protein
LDFDLLHSFDGHCHRLVPAKFKLRLIDGCDSMPILQQALHAARSFQPMDSSHVAALLAKTAKAAEAGQFELYKTSHQFDGTYANPQWLG